MTNPATTYRAAAAELRRLLPGQPEEVGQAMVAAALSLDHAARMVDSIARVNPRPPTEAEDAYARTLVI